MDNKNKPTFKEILLKTISTKTFWRLCVVFILLLMIMITVIVDLRVDKAKADEAARTEQSDFKATVNEDVIYVTPEDAGHEPIIEDVIIEDEDTDVTAATKIEAPEPEDVIVDITEVEPEETVNNTENVTEDEPEVIYDIYEPEWTDVDMLALVIYQEAGGDATCDECRYRVADVVLNRVASDRFPNTIYEVLTQHAQYGRLSWTGLVWPERASYEVEAHAVERAYLVAQDVLNGNHSELYGNGYIWQAEFVQGSDNIYCCGHYFGR